MPHGNEEVVVSRDWPKHGYSVRNIRNFRGMEGEGFNATLYRDGRRIAFVIDDASGGEIRIQWTDPHTRDKEEVRLLEFLKTLPKERSEDVEYTVSADMFIATLVDEASNENRLRRLFRTRTLFRLKGDRTDDDKWRVIKAPFSPSAKAHLVKKYGDSLAQVLNEEYPHLNPGSDEKVR